MVLVKRLFSLAACVTLFACSRVTAAEHTNLCRYCGRQHAATMAPHEAPPAPGDRKYAPDRQVDVLHIKLDVTPDFEKHTLRGTATLRFAPIAKPLTSLRLDAINLDVKEIGSSHEVRDYSSDDDSLTIVFKEPVPVGAEASVEIHYSAEPVEGFYFRTPQMGLPKEDTHCWTQGEPHEARHWFPSFDYPNERSSSEIICHIPKEMTMISNGRKMGEQDEEDGLKAVHWIQEKPHVTYLICMVAGHLKKLEARHRDIPLGFYTQPSKAEHAVNAFRDTADIMAFYEDEIGAPFPWDKYDQVTCADYHWGGMENTTITTLTQKTIFADETENIRSSRSLDAHEMAHQWFGDYITCKDWSHIWLNEGFATYYALLYEGHKFGHEALQYGLYLDARDDIVPQVQDRRPIVYRKYQDPGDQFDFRAYPKGSWVLHMLRSQLGEELYRKAIQTYLKRFALGNVESEDLREVFEELSGRPLDRFFDQWVYHGGLPELKVTYQWQAEDKVAHVTIEQTQKTDDDVLLFDIPTKLRFIVGDKTVDEEITVKDRQHDFYVALPAEPSVVRFDPDYTVLAKVSFDKSDKLLLAQLKNDKDAIGRVLACDELAKRKSEAVIKALKKTLNSDPFFGVRISAATALRKIGSAEAFEALAGSLDQSDARVRQKVVDEIGQSHREEARETLLKVADTEKNPAIVATAIRSLGLFQSKETSAAVRKALAANTWNYEPVGAAFLAIRELKEPQFGEDLMKAIKSREAELDPRDVSEGMLTLAEISQRGRRQQAAFDFLAGYLSHQRQTLRASAAAALGKLHDADARALLEPLAAHQPEDRVSMAAEASLKTLDEETRLVPAEVSKLRSEVRDLRKSQDELKKTLEELQSKSTSAKPAKAKSGSKED